MLINKIVKLKISGRIWITTIIIIILNAIIRSDGLKILHYSIPRMVDLNNVTSITLDCSYSYDPGDVKLVIRWFHNKSPEPIYQWIPEPDIRYVSEMIRPYFDMEFQINQDRYGRYRALRLDLQRSRSIFGPPISLSGNYSCVISSISNQETRESQMILYVPPKIFEFNFIHYDSERIALECLVDGVYPKPILSFQEQYSQRADFSSVSLSSPSSPSSSQFDFFQHLHRNPSAVQQQSSVNVNITESDIEPFLYSASFLHPIKSILTAGTIYECKLQLPGTIYLRKKRIKIIFPTSKREYSL
ncbi:hypothetical protein SSS_03795 [Sarcoptes scabiei]|uniref:Ig-like domain-containing protein n=1 Tax=Sarcoptes scabiei TaxID=52283 RepID=A0A834R4L5_SARSC|nr:hypothetical protein SSS_03795 [Sarcoptes scabiei]